MDKDTENTELYYVARTVRLYHDVTKTVRRLELMVQTGDTTSGTVYHLYCTEEEDSTWSWRCRSLIDHTYLYDLPVLPNLALMSEEELFQAELIWDTLPNSDIMDFEVIHRIQKYHLSFVHNWVNSNQFDRIIDW